MKKTTKALYSAVAGLALIAATGNATYASWIDTAPLGSAGNQIQTGDLRLDFTEAGYSSYQQVLWTLTPSANSGSTAVTNQRNLGTVLVGPGDVLVGTTQIRATLVGDTIQANLLKPQWNFTQEGSADLVAWFNASRTTVTIAHTDRGHITGTNYTTNAGTQSGTAINLNTTDVYTVTIRIEFATTGYPTNSMDRQTAARHMGNIYLELLQQTGLAAFRATTGG